MVEQVVFADDATRRAEQSTSCTVVSHDVIRENHFGRPCQVLHAIFPCFRDFRRQGIGKSDFEHFRPGLRQLVNRLDRPDCVDMVPHRLHPFRLDELHAVSRFTPFETPGLRVHITRMKRMIVHTTCNSQIGAMHIDGIVGHVLIQAIFRDDHAFASRKMSRIGLRGEKARVVIAPKTNAKSIQDDIFAHLCQ